MTKISECLEAFLRIFGKAKSHIRTSYFFHIHRRFLQGFVSPHFDGVIFERGADIRDEQAAGRGGTRRRRRSKERGYKFELLSEDDNDDCNPKTVLRYKGGSAAQFLFIQMLDLLLGISQPDEVKSFQEEMRYYMPREHRAFLWDYASKMKSGISLPSYVRQRAENDGSPHGKALLKAYNDNITKLKAFRLFHLGVAYRYITAGEKGTGSTPWKSFLQKAADATSKARLPCCCMGGGGGGLHARCPTSSP